MNSASHIAENPLLSFNLSEYSHHSVTDEEWDALGVNPFKDGEAEKYTCMEPLVSKISQV